MEKILIKITPILKYITVFLLGFLTATILLGLRFLGQI